MANSYSIPSPKKVQFDLSVIPPIELPNDLAEVDKAYLYWLSILQCAQREVDTLAAHKIKVLRRMPYQEYLQTDHWKHVRKFMLEFAASRCQLCNTQEKTLHVHHRTYENRGCENVGDLIVLCADCHGQFHEKLELSK